ncbi:MAG: glycosyltransferase family 2 protein [Oscillatoria sp. PMC 1068.18]|nr:glycosyltransferase family 2 protein [Oscillatoria sp. PMC 1076.18]MEC4987687.1 glycosyltransferase family 2 protein [Oscillatoria sp. PMC 1068.18]
MEPLISVVIPTYNRADLVKRAVQSALAQTISEIEVIVIIDGPHEETRLTLEEIADSRLRVIEKQTNQGCAASRKAGIDAAKGKWVAHLDDDDEWLPEKLAKQLKAVENSKYKYPIATCFVITRTPKGDYILPRRILKKSEHISEYLFVRSSFFQGEGLIQASTIFTSKELLEKVFPQGQRHDDWDWLLRVTTLEGVGIEFVEEPLSIWYLGENRQSLSSSKKWRYSFNWIQEKRDLVTPRAYSSFILAEISAKAAASRDWQVFLLLLKEASCYGNPRLKDVGLHLGMWVLTPEIRRKLRNLLRGNSQANQEGNSAEKVESRELELAQQPQKISPN